jgi:hypothetical protein
MFGATAGLEMLPMTANAEAAPTSVDWAASRATFPAVSRCAFLKYLLVRHAFAPLAGGVLFCATGG